jgi:hypothetical protein
MDSYAASNADNEIYINCVTPTAADTYSCQGVSFTTPDYDVTLDRVQFCLQKYNLPTGHVQAKLYAHSGTYGTSSLPTGTALAESETRDISTIPDYALSIINFKFTGTNKIVLTRNTYYCVVLHAVDGIITTWNRLSVWRDLTAPSHSGNSMTINNTGWIASSWDRVFYVYGELLDITNKAYFDYATFGHARFSVYNPKFDETLRYFEDMKPPELFADIKKKFEES